MRETMAARLKGLRKGWPLLLVGLVLGLIVGGGGDDEAGTPATPAAGKALWYTCSMHPQIKLHDPKALCPICGMELIPVTDESADAGSPRRLTMSDTARSLAEIETAPVERRFVVKQIRLVGKVDYDETRLRSITAWVPGRLDRLFVDYTGVAVRKGAPMVYMYSPELLVTQEGLLEAERALADMRRTGAAGSALSMQEATADALAQRLRLWGLTEEQVAEIRERGEASDHMTIQSPISGIVIHKSAVEGDYVGVGTKIYRIADLTRVWIYLDAYESDMEWIRYAQEVEFEAEAYPGEVFRGRTAFIDPFLNERTRTVRLRVTVDNADGRLKPGMFVRARIQARLADEGRIFEPYLQGKWISPVHPEIVTDEPGNCPICETPLVSAEALGYAGTDATPPLVIPATAPLRTGDRAVVYVEVPGADRPTYEGREVALGPRAGSHYIVTSGLREGERVVVKGNFKIDSALQILARPSMMSPTEDEGTPHLDVPESFLRGVNPLVRAYLAAQRALAGDDLEGARAALGAVSEAVDRAETGVLAGRAHERWMDLRAGILRAARGGSQAADLDHARADFGSVSAGLIDFAATFGQATGATLREVFCPMAFEDRGAAWLQEGEDVANPYFGASKLRCGEIRRTFAPVGAPHVRPAFVRALAPFYDALLATQRALAGDDASGARAAAALVAQALDGVAVAPDGGWLEDAWGELRGRGARAAERLAGSEDIAGARVAFGELSGVALALVRRFGHPRPGTLAEAYCPMAFGDRGAAWLQEGEKIANPYFGASMLECGEIRERFPGAPLEAGAPPIVREAISACVRKYLAVGAALAADDLESARTAAQALGTALADVPAGPLGKGLLAVWREEAGNMREAIAVMRKAEDLESARRPFALVSDALARVLKELGHAGPDDLVSVHCPMAFSNRGAEWIQRGEEIRNPYFGAAMLGCGDVRQHFPATPED